MLLNPPVKEKQAGKGSGGSELTTSRIPGVGVKVGEYVSLHTDMPHTIPHGPLSCKGIVYSCIFNSAHLKGLWKKTGESVLLKV